MVAPTGISTGKLFPNLPTTIVADFGYLICILPPLLQKINAIGYITAVKLNHPHDFEGLGQKARSFVAWHLQVPYLRLRKC